MERDYNYWMIWIVMSELVIGAGLALLSSLSARSSLGYLPIMFGVILIVISVSNLRTRR